MPSTTRKVRAVLGTKRKRVAQDRHAYSACVACIELERQFERKQQFRIEQRHDFLQMRVAAVVMANVQPQVLFEKRTEEALAKAEEEGGEGLAATDTIAADPPPQVEYDIWEDWQLEEDDEIEEPPPPPEPTSILPWGEISEEEQSLEVCMAVNDSKVAIAAAAEGVLVPLPVLAKPVRGDQKEIWEHFEAWYSMEYNEVREALLRSELKAAARDPDVAREWGLGKVEIPEEAMHDEEGTQLDDALLFQRWYFNTAEGAREPRLGFLEIKVAEMVRHLRVSAVELRNKIPTPVFTMTLPPVAVDRPELPVYRIKVYSWHMDAYTLEEMSEWYEDDELGLEDDYFAEAEKAEMERKALERQKAEEDAREKKRLEQDRKQVEIEDREAALARLLSKDMDDDADAIMELDGPPNGYLFDSPFDADFIGSK